MLQMDKTMTLALRCRDAAEKLSRLYGGFTLFSLIQWERPAGKWDVVVSAPWLSLNGTGIQQIVDGLRPFLSPEDWLQTGSVILFSPKQSMVEAMTRRFFAPIAAETRSGVD